MLHWLVAFATLGVPPLFEDSPPIAPTDLTVGSQTVELRGPLVARAPGVRLVLFVRDQRAVTGYAEAASEQFESAVPAGSVTAVLTGEDGRELTLEHTGYTYYRGFSGLVLSEQAPGPGQAIYRDLKLDTDIALPGVRFVWLDRDARTVRDVPGPR